MFETFDKIEELNKRKKILNSRSHDEQFNRNQAGFYTCSTSTVGQKKIEDIKSLGKTSSNMPKGPDYILNKMCVDEVLMRGYVYYDEGELDKENCKYALRWVKRIA